MAGLAALAVLPLPVAAAGQVQPPARMEPGITGLMVKPSFKAVGPVPLRTQEAAVRADQPVLEAHLPPREVWAATEPSSMRLMALEAGEAGEAALQPALVSTVGTVGTVGSSDRAAAAAAVPL